MIAFRAGPAFDALSKFHGAFQSHFFSVSHKHREGGKHQPQDDEEPVGVLGGILLLGGWREG